MIEIIHTKDLEVEVNGKMKHVTTRRFPTKQATAQDAFLMFYQFLKEQEELGYTKYYLYSMWTQQEGEIKYGDIIQPPHIALWIRGASA